MYFLTRSVTTEQPHLEWDGIKLQFSPCIAVLVAPLP